MIPRIIHYCWFGSATLPAEVQRYIDGWRRLMHDYEFRLTDASTFPVDYCTYSREAAAMGAWAFVSDVARLKVLSEEGGIYLDTDMELLKPLDPFLVNKSFIGSESTGPGCSVIGAEAGTPWIARFLDFYRHRHFINCWGHPVRTPNPTLMQRHILPATPADELPAVYPQPVFYPDLAADGKAHITADTVAIHHYAASWRHRKSLATRIATIARGLRRRYLPS